MLCSDTAGTMPAIYLPIKLHVVKEINHGIEDILLQGGDGEIKLLFRKGKLSTIEKLIRKLFGEPKQFIH
jgi:hypothetical protein